MPYLDFHHHHRNITHGIYNLELFEKEVNFPFSAGIHPKDILKNHEEAKKWLSQISKHPNCVAIGECGLDIFADAEEMLQKEVFTEHIHLANRRKKPLIIHCVKKHYEVIPFRKMANVPMIIHGFRKNKETANALLKNNFYLSFGKALLQSVSLQEILKETPWESFFLETDAADTAIAELYKMAGLLKNKSPQDIQDQMIKNLKQITK